MRNSLRLKEANGEETRSAIVIADNFESPFLIGDLAPVTQFLDEIPEEIENSATELYLLNLPIQRASLLSRNWLATEHVEVNYWVTHEHWEILDGFVKATGGLFLRDVTYDYGWIKLVLVGDPSRTLDKESFYRGLSSLKLAMEAGGVAFEGPALTEPSIRSLLVDKLVPLAKPMKRYIPKKFVIALYKILERIR